MSIERLFNGGDTIIGNECRKMMRRHQTRERACNRNAVSALQRGQNMLQVSKTPAKL